VVVADIDPVHVAQTSERLAKAHDGRILGADRVSAPGTISSQRTASIGPSPSRFPPPPRSGVDAAMPG
jgi:hypothetical protein